MPIVVHTHGAGSGPGQRPAGSRSVTLSGPWILIPVLIAAVVLVPLVFLVGLALLGIVAAYGAFLLLRVALGARKARRRPRTRVTVEHVRTGTSPFDDGWPGGEATRP